MYVYAVFVGTLVLVWLTLEKKNAKPILLIVPVVLIIFDILKVEKRNSHYKCSN